MDEVNRVARMMIDAEPAADLAARIRARLDEAPAGSPRRAWGTWQVAAGLAASLALAAVWSWGPEVLKSRGPEVQESRSLPAAAQIAALTRAEGPAVSPVVTWNSRTSGPQDPRTARPAVQPALSAEELAWMDRRIPALDPVVALRMDRLAVDSIQPEPLAITPLIMTTLPTSSAEVEQRINR